MAGFRISPLDRLVWENWKVQNKISEAQVEGLSTGFRTSLRRKRLLSEAEALGCNLDDETVRQLEAHTGADEMSK